MQACRLIHCSQGGPSPALESLTTVMCHSHTPSLRTGLGCLALLQFPWRLLQTQTIRPARELKGWIMTVLVVVEFRSIYPMTLGAASPCLVCLQHSWRVEGEGHVLCSLGWLDRSRGWMMACGWCSLLLCRMTGQRHLDHQSCLIGSVPVSVCPYLYYT